MNDNLVFKKKLNDNTKNKNFNVDLIDIEVLKKFWRYEEEEKS